MRVRTLAAFVLAVAWPSAVMAQAQPLSPGTRYDPEIPTLQQVLGYDFGERITPPEDVPRYLEALAAAAPDRTRLLEYARSWQNRPLWLFVVGSRERMARFDEIRAGRRQLADPRNASPAGIERLVKEQPVITALLHSVHGNEISGVDAALAEAYHLLAASGDATVDLIMRESIVLIDPMQNPDGRARFIASNTHGHAMEADPEPLAAERDEPWPGGRTNHYLFDLNRDWFPLNHPESQGKVKFLLEWLPQVVVDLHEMGGESQYYFPPAAPPGARHTTAKQREWMGTFGKANAARFDERGFQYFIREIYDSFYPGYGASWPFFFGGLGKTFEMASSRGLAYERRDGSVLTFRDGVLRHFTAAIQTAETAARHREQLLRDFIEFRRTAVSEGGATEYVLLPGGDRPRLEELGRRLVLNGIEVRRVEAPLTVAGRDVPEGALIVPLGQPMSRLVRNLLDPLTSMDEAFVEEQNRRRKVRLPDQIYDITAWSLPLLYDIDLVISEKPTGARATPFTTDARTSTPLAPAKVGYLIPWGTGAAAAAIEALKAGLTVRAAGGSFTHAGRQYGPGTVLLRNEENPANLSESVAALASRHGLDVVRLDSAWVDDGFSLGSNTVRVLRLPRVLLAWDAPVQGYSAGWARFTLERRFGQPVTALRVSSLPRQDLARFDVIVLPAGNYATALGEPLLARVREWIRNGGTLVTLGEASRWAVSERANLLGTYTELRDGKPDRPGGEAAAPAGTPPDEYDYDEAITPRRERPELTTGIIARVTMNMEHWLSSGTDGEVQVMVEGDRVFAPLTLEAGTNVGVYAEQERLLASGLMWEEAQQQLARKAYLLHQPHGAGHVIAFAEDPNFRGFTELTQLLFMNAVLFGPVR